MRRILKRRPSPAMAVSIVALVMATTGTAVATHERIFSSDIADGTIQSRDIGLDVIQKQDVGDNAFGSREVYDGAIGGIDIKTNDLTGADINEATVGAAGVVNPNGTLQAGARNATVRPLSGSVYCIAVTGITNTAGRPISLTIDRQNSSTSVPGDIQTSIEWDTQPDACNIASEYEVQTFRQVGNDVQANDEGFAFFVM